MKRLKVTEHHGRTNDSEVVSVEIDADDKYYVVIEHLASTKSIVVDFIYPDKEKIRHEHIYYG